MYIMTIMQQTPKMNPIVGLLCCAGLIVVVIGAGLYLLHRSGHTPGRLQDQYDKASALGSSAKKAVVPRKSVLNGHAAQAAVLNSLRRGNHPAKSAGGGISSRRDGNAWIVEILSEQPLMGWRFRVAVTDARSITGPVEFRPEITSASQAVAIARPRLASQVPAASDFTASRSGDNWVVSGIPRDRRHSIAMMKIHAKTHRPAEITFLNQAVPNKDDE